MLHPHTLTHLKDAVQLGMNHCGCFVRVFGGHTEQTHGLRWGSDILMNNASCQVIAFLFWVSQAHLECPWIVSRLNDAGMQKEIMRHHRGPNDANGCIKYVGICASSVKSELILSKAH